MIAKKWNQWYAKCDTFKTTLGGFLPYAFTEDGALMLENVLKSKQALEFSLKCVKCYRQIKLF
jgi:hypothetical protein